jgi:hypothetical protein
MYDNRLQIIKIWKIQIYGKKVKLGSQFHKTYTYYVLNYEKKKKKIKKKRKVIINP